MSFEDALVHIQGHTLISRDRLKLLYDKVKETMNLYGDMAEIGVYRGGSSYILGIADPSRFLYVCDSFEGLPETTIEDKMETGYGHGKGNFSDTTMEMVSTLLKDLPNKEIIKGFFPNEIIHHQMCDNMYSMVHIDVDLYQPTLDCLEFFWDRMVDGGIIVSDDYQWRATPGVKRAFDKFCGDNNIQVNDSGFNSCWIQK